MKFELHIELGNEAMSTELNVADKLYRVSREVRYEGFPPEGEEQLILDYNGNQVGYWKVA